MKARVVVPVALSLAVAACDGPIAAYCGGNLIDACSKARDLATVVSMQLADEAVGEGNAIMAESGALHDRGPMEMSVRAKVMSRNVPSVDNVMVRTDATTASSNFGVDAGSAASVASEFALRVSRGTRVGATRVAGLDLLGGLRLSGHSGDGSIHMDGSTVGFSYGARLGILQETNRLPAVSLTGMIRRLPTFSMTTEPLSTEGGFGTVSLSLSNGKIATHGFRLAASKQLGRFGLSGGVGRESYQTTFDFSAGGAGTEKADFSATRNTAFIGGSLGIRSAKLGVELGSVFGGQAPSMTNSFDEVPTAARTFMSVGVRFPLGRAPAQR